MPGFLDRASPPHILTLVVITAVSTLTINVFLPSLPGMARHFAVDYAVIQLTVSVYLVSTALLQLGIGPAADRFGRRPVMLVCLAIFVVGSLIATFAPTIEVLLGARILQSFSVAGMVLARVIVRDTVASDEAASRIGYVTMGMALVPMIAPMIGGVLDEIHGWQAPFALMLAFGVIAFLMVVFDLGETNPSAPAGMLTQLRAYPALFGSLAFWSYTLTAAFTAGSFFTLVGAGPIVATDVLGLRPSEYGLYFGIVSLGYVLGNFVSGRFSRQAGMNRMMLWGNLASAFGTLVALGLFAAGSDHALALFGPMVLLGVGNGMILPSASAGIVSVHPHLAGSASGLGGAVQLGISAVMSALAGILAAPQAGGVMALLGLMLACGLASTLAALTAMLRTRRS